jgi:hypothetical protein
MRTHTKHLSVLALLSACAGAAVAQPMKPGNLIIMRVADVSGANSGAVFLDEYTPAGVLVSSGTIAFPDSGPDAISLPRVTNRDRHLHTSGDGRFVSFAAYNYAPGANDPAGLSPTDAPRTAVLVKFDRTVDMSTRLTDAFSFTTVRAAVTNTGNEVWICDNASGAVSDGGLHYAVKGGSTSVNLSVVQDVGVTPTPDNIRDVLIFNGQLYECSGSDASVGKATFQVGTGLPTSGRPALMRLNTDSASPSSFALLDLDPTIPGPDVLYSVVTTPSVSLRKHVKQADGTWAPKGVYSTGSVDQIVARREQNGSVTLYFGATAGFSTLVDPVPLTSTLSGSQSSFLITPPAGFKFGGMAFAAHCNSPADVATLGGALGGDNQLTVDDLIVFLGGFFANQPFADIATLGGGAGADGQFTADDLIFFLSAFFSGCN